MKNNKLKRLESLETNIKEQSAKAISRRTGYRIRILFLLLFIAFVVHVSQVETSSTERLLQFFSIAISFGMFVIELVSCVYAHKVIDQANRMLFDVELKRIDELGDS